MSLKRLFFSLPIFSLLFFSSVSHSQTADTWSQFRANPTLTGISPSTVPDTLKLLWTYDAKESIESSAAIADGTLSRLAMKWFKRDISPKS